MAAEPATTPTDTPPAPKGDRGDRAVRFGVVSSTKGDKTITVTVQRLVRHDKYGKMLQRRSKLHAHDEENTCTVGDQVWIIECRPYSKTKHWRLLKIHQKSATAADKPKAPQGTGA